MVQVTNQAFLFFPPTAFFEKTWLLLPGGVVALTVNTVSTWPLKTQSRPLFTLALTALLFQLLLTCLEI